VQRIAAKHDETLTAGRDEAMEPLPEVIATEAEAEKVVS
jgi:DNA-directed RNA polymerase subunit beta'